MSTARDGNTATTRAELWIQPVPSPGEEFEPVIRRLARLVQRGVIDGYQVETWDRYLDLSGGEHSRERAHFDRFAHWAWAHAVDLPGAERLRVGIGRNGPERLVQRTPTAVLAEYEDDVLVRVTPGADDTCLVERLDELADREADVRAEGRSADASTEGRETRRKTPRVEPPRERRRRERSLR